MEFLRILEEFRCKCEEEGNYLEAGRAHQQLETLRKQEERRQQKSVRARQIAERQDVQIAHNMQFTDFNSAWDKYLDEYDKMAQMCVWPRRRCPLRRPPTHPSPSAGTSRR